MADELDPRQAEIRAADASGESTGEDTAAMKRTTWKQLAEFSQIGFILPVAVVVGWLAGAALDRWLHTKWLYLAGVILGSVAGFIELIRTMLKKDGQD